MKRTQAVRPGNKLQCYTDYSYVSITDRELTTSALCPVSVPAPVTYNAFRSRLTSATVCGDTGVVAIMTARAYDNDVQHRDDVDLEFGR